VPVIILDSNPAGIRRAEESNFPVVYGDALQESVMQRARFGFVRTVVAMTANRTLNSVFVGRARERFHVPRGLVSTSEAGVGLVSEQVVSGEAEIVFDGPHDIERWEVRGRRGDVRVEYFDFEPIPGEEEDPKIGSGGLSERSVILSIVRDGATEAMRRGRSHNEGDIAAIAIHLPEREDALRELASQGWQPRPEDSVTEETAEAIVATADTGVADNV